MAPRTIGALALRPSGNVQGGFHFYNLATRCIISRRHWTSLPMPVEIINVVHEWAEKDKASKGINYGDGTPAGLSDVGEEGNVTKAINVRTESDSSEDDTVTEYEMTGVIDDVPT